MSEQAPNPLAGLRRANAELAAARRAALNLLEDAVLARDALRVSQERQAFLLALTDALRPLADPLDVQTTAGRLLGEHLGVTRAFYAEVDPDGDGFTIHRDYASGVPSIAGRHRLSWYDGHTRDTWAAGRVAASADVSGDELTADQRAAVAGIQVRAWLGVPLRKDGRVVAVLGLHHAEPRAWTPAEVAVVEAAAERTWAAVERAKAEAAVRAGEERLQQIVESATDYAILTLDDQGRITSWSQGAAATFGYAMCDIVGRPVDVLFTPEDRASGEAAKDVETARATGRAADERWHLRKDGTRFYASGVLTRLAAGGFVKVARDLTARKRQEEELERRVAERTAELAAALDALEGEMARRRALARRLATAQEDERRRVSRDLHDTLGQLQAAMGLTVAAVLRTPGLPPAAADRLAEVQRLSDTLARETHALATRLRPTALDDFGLGAALAQLTADWAARTGVPVEFETVGLDDGRLPSEVETAVYRMVQESLTNVQKHAGGTRVGVTVTRTGGAALVAVEDDGVGFDPAAVAPGRLGLLGMRERVELAGGTLEVETGGGGTTVFARFALTGDRHE